MKVKGISREIVNLLLKRSNKLGQGRTVGVIGFVDKQGCIVEYGKIIDGGLSGLPFRQLLGGVMEQKRVSLLELINQLPANAVVISTSPGKTGIIISTGGINIFDVPIVKIGVKDKKAVGVGIIYPDKSLFELATRAERVELNILAALNMDEERKALRESSELRLEYLGISEKLPVLDIPAQGGSFISNTEREWTLPREKVQGLSHDLASRLVNKSVEIEQGREVAVIGMINESGLVEQAGEIVVGGMGYVPSRLLVNSYVDISEISLREAYTRIIPEKAVIVHTHPGGTGVMHMGDAIAAPGTWGRPIIAIGHDKAGQIKGASVIDSSEEISRLIDEYEEIEQHFFIVNTAQEETRLRKRRYQIAQEFTDLCREIVIK